MARVAEGKNLVAARAGHAGDPPDWVARLAEACDAATQTRIATRLGVSAATVNQVIRGRYGASTDRIEQLVRGRLMAAVVACPQLGELAADLCQEWQGRARATPATAFHRRMAGACRACPHSRIPQEDVT